MQRAIDQGRLRVIVGLRLPVEPEHALDAAGRRRQRAAIAAAQSGLLRDIGGAATSVKTFDVVPVIALEVDAIALRALLARADVSSVEEDGLLRPTLAESTRLVGATTAWSRGYTGSGSTVAILDSGVDAAHPFLGGRIVSEACYSTTSSGTTALCVDGSTAAGAGSPCSVSAECAHGTHVAGIAAGAGTSFSGMAPSATLIAMQVFSRAGSGELTAFFSDVELALQRVYDLRATFPIAAVNLSLGSSSVFSTPCDTVSPSMTTMIGQLRDAGIATVVSAGNGGATAGLSFPACVSTAISVGSTRDGSGGATPVDSVSAFSNSAPFLTLLAPGEWITSSIPGSGFATYSGTSMAAPHVAGALALLRSRNPAASVAQLLDALRASGPNLTDPRNQVTKRRLDVDAALSALTSPCSYAINPSSVTITAGAASGSVNVITQPGCAWTAASGAAFITIDSPEEGSGPGAVAFTVAANGTTNARTGTAVIAGRTFTVTQQAATAPCTFALDASGVTMPAAGGRATVAVTSPSAGCAWTATTTSAFVSFADAEPHAGSGSVTFDIPPSYSTASRTAGATIAGLPFTITQTGVAVDSGSATRERARADFDGDSRSDLLWQDTTTGYRAAWFLQGGHSGRTAAYLNPAAIDLDWEIAGAGDFNGDGKPDLVWHHRTRGTLYLWYMDGVTRVGDGYFTLNGISDPRWKVVAVADFNGDSHPDLLWQHDTAGWLAVWFFNDRTFIAGADLTPNQVDVPWKIVGAADFNADGQTDLVWRNRDNGMLGVWLMNGTTRLTFVPLSIPAVDDLDWTIAAVIDVDGDQTPDLVWRHASRGYVAIWYMNGITRMDAQTFPLTVENTWKIAGPK